LFKGKIIEAAGGLDNHGEKKNGLVSLLWRGSSAIAKKDAPVSERIVDMGRSFPWLPASV
jgi:hypothetical protein